MADTSTNGTSSVGRPSTSQDVANGTGSAAPASSVNKASENILYSDIGINVLLTKLKQSIASARDFGRFLKTRSSLEEDHASGLRKLARSTSDATSRMEMRQGTYAANLASVTSLHERMADNGLQFAQSLLQMHEDLNDLAANMDRQRKHWKQEGLNNEKRVKDAESAMEKAKSRYQSAADGYERAKTGDSSGRAFGIKGPKSAEQREEDLLRKAQGADTDYKGKVDAAQLARKENTDSHRPRAVRELQELVKECDNALLLQLQKFANFNERLIVGNGMVVSPMTDAANGSASPSMREMIQGIDNDRDFHMFVTSHTSQLPPKPADITYQKHSALGGTGPSSPTTTRPRGMSQSATNSTPSTTATQQPSFANKTTASPTSTQPPLPQYPSSQPNSSQAAPTLPPVSTSTGPSSISTPRQASASSAGPGPAPSLPLSSAPTSNASTPQNSGFQAGRQQTPDRSFRGPPSGSQAPPYSLGPSHSAQKSSISQPAPISQPYRPTGAPATGPPGNAWNEAKQSSPITSHPPRGSSAQPNGPSMGSSTSTPTSATAAGAGAPGQLQPYNRVFGMNLDELFRRDDSAVPLVVYQCIQAVDLFGLDTEGIYRTNGNASHIAQLRQRFDHDSSKIDFRDPESFFHDVNSVAGLLKMFFRDLPNPLFTAEHYQEFIDAARIEDPTTRRDSLHAIINALPDPNYATIRAVVLHLWRVQEHGDRNRMNTQSLAICFAPTMMGGAQGMGQGRDTAMQARVVETVLSNTFMIFDED